MVGGPVAVSSTCRPGSCWRGSTAWRPRRCAGRSATSGVAHLVALGVAGVLLAAGPGGPSGARGGPTGGRWRALRAGAGAAVVVATVVVAVAAVARAGPDLVGRPLGVGAEAWRAGGAVVVVVDGRARPSAVLDGLRQAGVDRLDIVVVRTPSRAALEVAALLRQRWRGSAVLVPRSGVAPAAAVPVLAGAGVPPVGATVEVGGLRLRATEVTDRLVVDLEVARAAPVGANRPGPVPPGTYPRRSCPRPPCRRRASAAPSSRAEPRSGPTIASWWRAWYRRRGSAVRTRSPPRPVPSPGRAPISSTCRWGLGSSARPSVPAACRSSSP